MRGLRALCSSAVLVASLAACGAAPPGASPAGGDGVSPTLSVATPGSGGGTGSDTSSAHPTSSTTTTPVIKVTDDVFAGLTEAQARRLRDSDCRGSIGVPGKSDICWTPRELTKCMPKDPWCFRMADIPGSDLGIIQVVDRSPDKKLCGKAQERCPVIVVTRQVTSGVHVSTPATTSTSKPTTPSGPSAPPVTTSTPSPTANPVPSPTKPPTKPKPSTGPGPSPPPAATVTP